MVENVSVVSNTFEAGYVKGAVAIWSGTYRITVQNNAILDAGLRLPNPPGTDLGRYAILIYNSAHVGPRLLPGLHPDTIWIVGNTITNPYSCGVYVASAQNLEVTGNRISGQRDRYDVTLPKGAIALAGATNVRVQGNELSDNYVGIAAVAGTTPVSVDENQIVVPPGGVRARIAP
jgi:Right handed beta helix region